MHAYSFIFDTRKKEDQVTSADQPMESTSSKQKHHHHLVLGNIELDNIELDMKTNQV